MPGGAYRGLQDCDATFPVHSLHSRIPGCSRANSRANSTTRRGTTYAPDGGAWDYHRTLIANTQPPKPIRVWLQVGDRDLLNPNIMRDDMHDWVAANHRMAAALKQSGYQYQYVFALDSGHCDARVRNQSLPEALEWVWRRL